MSRYYQSSYHGFNDYRKYKEERLKTNQNNGPSTLKSPYQQSYDYRSLQVLNNNKEHLQTFGREDKLAYSYENDLRTGDISYQSRDLSRKSRYQNYDTSQINIDDQIPSRYASMLKDHSNTKSRSHYPSYQQTYQLNQNSTSETYQNTYRINRSNSHLSNKHEAIPEMLTNNNFEDVVISRRKNYDYAGRKDEPSQQSYKGYNYSSKINTNNSYQASELHNFVEDKTIHLKRSEQGLERSKTDKINQLSSIQSHQKVDSTTSYQTRNELIRQRLNLNSNVDLRSSSILRSGLKQQPQQDQNLDFAGYTSKYFPQTQKTPQKTQVTPKADRDLSEKRRKSLIQKSQMLKQKLNKLNTSSTKLQKNQEEDQMKSGTENQNQKQNITSQGYTPSKRYLSTSFQSNRENQQPIDRSLSKKLDFDVKVKDPEISKNYDTTLKESNRNYSRNHNKTYQRQPIQNQIQKDQNSFLNKKSNNLQSNDGALKKIQELNQRINSRLESILKNYG